ncbi:MAG: YncE family protein [Actinomycetota bacterium]
MTMKSHRLRVLATLSWVAVFVVFIGGIAIPSVIPAKVVQAQTWVKDIEIEGWDVAVNPSTNLIYILGYDDDGDHVFVIDGETDTIVKTIDISSIGFDIEVNPVTNKVYATGLDIVTVIDGSSGTIVKTIAVGEDPSLIGINTATDKIYVAYQADSPDANTITVISGATDDVAGSIPVATSPSGIAVDSVSGRVFISCQEDGSLCVINGQTDAVEKVVVLGYSPWKMVYNQQANSLLMIGSGILHIHDGVTFAQIGATHIDYSDIAIDPVSNRLYMPRINSHWVKVWWYPEAGALQIEDGTTGRVLSEAVTWIDPIAVAVNPVTSKVYIVCEGDRYLRSTTCLPGMVTIVQDLRNRPFYFAEGTCRPGFDAYICVQNPGDTEANVTITYMLGDGSTKTQDLKVGPHSRFTAHPAGIIGVGDDAAHDFSAKVECTNGQQIVVERPTYFNYQGKWTGGHDVVGSNGAIGSFDFAEGTTRPGFDPYFCVQNPTDEPTAAKVVYKLGDGEEKETDYFQIQPHSRYTVHPSDFLGVGDDASYDFSATVECWDPPDSIIVERPMYFDYKGWTGGTDALGATSPATMFYFAEGTARPGFDPYICIQNAADDSYQTQPAEVRITYMLGEGSTKTQDVTIPASARATVHPADILGVGDDAAHDFSCMVECLNETPIVAERPMYFNYQGKWTGGSDVVGTTAPSSTFYFAEGTCRPGFDTYFCVQNPGDEDAAVHLTYMMGDGGTREQDISVGANSRQTVNCHDLLGYGDGAAYDFSTKVECTNGQNIVVERPMYFDYHGWTGGHDVVGYQK